MMRVYGFKILWGDLNPLGGIQSPNRRPDASFPFFDSSPDPLGEFRVYGLWRGKRWKQFNKNTARDGMECVINSFLTEAEWRSRLSWGAVQSRGWGSNPAVETFLLLWIKVLILIINITYKNWLFRLSWGPFLIPNNQTIIWSILLLTRRSINKLTKQILIDWPGLFNWLKHLFARLSSIDDKLIDRLKLFDWPNNRNVLR